MSLQEAVDLLTEPQRRREEREARDKVLGERARGRISALALKRHDNGVPTATKCSDGTVYTIDEKGTRRRVGR